MKNTKVSSPLFDIYPWVWKSCLNLWPLFWVQFLFLILQYVTLFLCLALIFGPFAERNMDKIAEGLSHPQDYDWIPVLSDWVSTASDPTWIAITVGLVVLYLTWWCLLSALSDGGVFRTFWDYFQKGQPFTWGLFFREAFQWMIPMLWLQLYLSFWALGAFLIWGMMALIVVGLLALAAFKTLWVILAALFLGLPSILFWLVFSLGFAVFSFLSKAFLTKGLQAKQAVREAFQKFKEDRWRVGLGLLVAFLTYIGVSIALRVVLKVLSLVPVLGPGFSLLDMLSGIALTLLMMVYLSGLSVAYLQDEAGA